MKPIVLKTKDPSDDLIGTVRLTPAVSGSPPQLRK